MKLIEFVLLSFLVLCKQIYASNSLPNFDESNDGSAVVTPDSPPKASLPYYNFKHEIDSEEIRVFPSTSSSNSTPHSNDLAHARTTRNLAPTPSCMQLLHNTGQNGQLLVSEGSLVNKGVIVASGERPLVATFPTKILGIKFTSPGQLLLEYRKLNAEEKGVLNRVIQKHQADCYHKLPQFIDKDAVEKRFVIDGRFLEAAKVGTRVIEGQVIAICAKHDSVDRIAVASSTTGSIKSITQVESNRIVVIIAAEQRSGYSPQKTLTPSETCIIL